MWLKRTLVLSELFDFLQSTINWRMPCTALDKTFVLATDSKTAKFTRFLSSHFMTETLETN